MATHSPILMALPGARVLEITRGGIAEADFRQTRHFALYRSFVTDPDEFIAAALAGDDDAL
jgi:predicted ATPase